MALSISHDPILSFEDFQHRTEVIFQKLDQKPQIKWSSKAKMIAPPLIGIGVAAFSAGLIGFAGHQALFPLAQQGAIQLGAELPLTAQTNLLLSLGSNLTTVIASTLAFFISGLKTTRFINQNVDVQIPPSEWLNPLIDTDKSDYKVIAWAHPVFKEALQKTIRETHGLGANELRHIATVAFEYIELSNHLELFVLQNASHPEKIKEAQEYLTQHQKRYDDINSLNSFELHQLLFGAVNSWEEKQSLNKSTPKVNHAGPQSPIRRL